MMQKDKRANSRRKFVALAATIIPGFSILSLGIRLKGKTQTVKMLTQDGRLVEVDKRMLAGSKEKINNNDLKNWVKRKKNQQSNRYNATQKQVQKSLPCYSYGQPGNRLF